VSRITARCQADGIRWSSCSHLALCAFTAAGHDSPAAVADYPAAPRTHWPFSAGGAIRRRGGSVGRAPVPSHGSPQHAQAEATRYLIDDKHAHYLIIEGNQPTRRN
jgi:hypothetical protein